MAWQGRRFARPLHPTRAGGFRAPCTHDEERSGPSTLTNRAPVGCAATASPVASTFGAALPSTPAQRQAFVPRHHDENPARFLTTCPTVRRLDARQRRVPLHRHSGISALAWPSPRSPRSPKPCVRRFAARHRTSRGPTPAPRSVMTDTLGPDAAQTPVTRYSGRCISAACPAAEARTARSGCRSSQRLDATLAREAGIAGEGAGRCGGGWLELRRFYARDVRRDLLARAQGEAHRRSRTSGAMPGGTRKAWL